MENNIQEALYDSIKDFQFPRYHELPNVGLYLEQTVKYINLYLNKLGGIQITGSMIRNYVKQGLIINPINKLYYADQIGYLICITILKQVVPLEAIHVLFFRQKSIYENQIAYDYFCMEMENILYYRFGRKNSIDEIGVTSSIEKEMLRSAIISVSHIIYLNHCFQLLSKRDL